jgi:hypothetical protein
MLVELVYFHMSHVARKDMPLTDMTLVHPHESISISLYLAAVLIPLIISLYYYYTNYLCIYLFGSIVPQVTTYCYILLFLETIVARFVHTFMFNLSSPLY